MNPIDRRLVEALKKSPYVKIVFEFGHDEMLIEAKDKILSHEIGIAVQGYINRKEKNNGK